MKAKIKEEAHYMKLGAKVLPQVVGKKVKGAVREYWENVKENARLQAEAEREAKQAEKEAYKITLIEQARLRGQTTGRQRAARQGAGGILAQLGEAGKRMSTPDLFGFGEQSGLDGREKKAVSASDYMFSGFGQSHQKASKQVRVVHHVHHYPKKKRRD